MADLLPHPHSAETATLFVRQPVYCFAMQVHCKAMLCLKAGIACLFCLNHQSLRADSRQTLSSRLCLEERVCHQLDLVTPIKSPCEAILRKQMRESLQKRYTPRPRPVTMHRFLNRVGEPFRFKLFSIWSDLNLTSWGRERSWIIDLYSILFNSCLLQSCLRLLSLSA